MSRSRDPVQPDRMPIAKNRVRGFLAQRAWTLHGRITVDGSPLSSAACSAATFEGAASGTRGQHAQLVARGIGMNPPWQVHPVRMELTAAALGYTCRDGVGIVLGLKPDVEMQAVLLNAFWGRLRAQLKEGTPQRWVAQG